MLKHGVHLTSVLTCVLFQGAKRSKAYNDVAILWLKFSIYLSRQLLHLQFIFAVTTVQRVVAAQVQVTQLQEVTGSTSCVCYCRWECSFFPILC